MPKKILTINEKYSDNIGDQAISRAMVEFCNYSSDVSVDAVDFSFRKQLVPISNVVKKGTKLVILKRFIPALAKKVIFFIKNINNAKNISHCGYDLAIIGGGQLLLGKGTFPFSLFLYTFFLHRAGTRIKIVAAGVGRSFSGLERFLIAQSLKKVEAIYLRDVKSIDNLKINFNKHSSLIPDIAYFLYNESKVSKQGNKIIICPTEYSVYKRYEDEASHKNLSFDGY
ncbi:TPA: polysaccharide pyruvyl transferase family protein, partial [Kluyvera georgiana]